MNDADDRFNDNKHVQKRNSRTFRICRFGISLIDTIGVLIWSRLASMSAESSWEADDETADFRTWWGNLIEAVIC